MAFSSTLDTLKAELSSAYARRVAAEQEELALSQAISVLEGGSLLLSPDHAPRLDFSGLGIVEAAKRLIRETGEPLSTGTIAEKILARGVVTVSKRYVPTVYATLNNSLDFKRVGGSGRKGKWDLAANQG